MKKNAFTLAEVLITLGIIGIVAAMTIPALVQKQQKTQAITSVKKAYSVLNQNLKMAVAQNGPPSGWIGSEESPSYPTTLKYFNQYIKPYYKIATICSGETAFISNYGKKCGYKSDKSKRSGGWENYDLLGQWGNRVVFATPDGMIYFFYPYTTTCTEMDTSTPENPQYACSAKSNGTFDIAVDINGPKNPNTWGKDIFSFILNPEKETIMPNGYTKSAEEVNEDCSKSKYTGGLTCATKLINDGWEMKEDYPW